LGQESDPRAPGDGADRGPELRGERPDRRRPGRGCPCPPPAAGEVHSRLQRRPLELGEDGAARRGGPPLSGVRRSLPATLWRYAPQTRQRRRGRDSLGSAPMEDLGAPASYLTLAEGMPVYSSDGEELGKIEHVLADPDLDVFDGIVLDTSVLPGGQRFADATQVAECYER